MLLATVKQVTVLSIQMAMAYIADEQQLCTGEDMQRSDTAEIRLQELFFLLSNDIHVVAGHAFPHRF